MIRAIAGLLLCCGMTSAASYPVLSYSTYLRDSFTPNAIAMDGAGNVYLAGSATIDPENSTSGAMVVKLNPQTNLYSYVSFLNGQTGQAVRAVAVDAQGSAYVAGSYTAATGAPQAFAAKLDANGNTVFSTPIGAGIAGAASAIAVTPAGEAIVTGTSSGAGFPSTPGAYSVPNTSNHPWLVKLNAAGTQVVFSATGIGGSAIALDVSGNIYVAGTTMQLDYPTTPGVYQPAFPAFIACTGFLCQIGAQGMNQYVSKIDPAGSQLIYSTALTGTGTGTTNTGLAVDSAGNVYVTGFAGSGYPYTVNAPAIVPKYSTATFAGLPFLSKLDPSGKDLLFSVPVGGSGVQVDASGNVYVGGSIGDSVVGPTYSVDGSVVPALAGVPSQCLPNELTGANAAYAAQVDVLTGNVLGTQFLGGSTLRLAAAAFSGSAMWVTGTTGDAYVPYTPNALISYASPDLKTGAYLGSVDFSQPQPPEGTPQIACMVDSSNFSPAGPAERYQLLTVLGSNLGPAMGVAASDSGTTSLGGVQVGFGGVNAPLLYASSTQINLAVPLLPYAQQASALQISVGGATSAARAVPLAFASPQLFLNVPMSTLGNSSEYVALALNADGSLNSPSNAARIGSTVSVFVNGLIPDPQVTTGGLQLLSDGFTVVSVERATPFVQKVEIQLPLVLANNFSCPSNQAPLCSAGFSLSYGFGGGLGELSLSPVNAGRDGRGWIWVNR